MNGLDILIITVFMITIILGLWKGFLRIAVSWATVIIGFALASAFYRTAADMLQEWIEAPKFREIAGFILIFLAVAIAGALVLWFTRGILRSLKLLWLDRLAGATTGFAFGLTLSTIIIIFLAYITPEESSVIKQSVLAPYTMELANGAVSVVPGEIKDRFRERRKMFREYWQKLKQEEVLIKENPEHV